MQTTIASSICPLCKSPAGAVANSNPLPTRLCDQCRAMLATILPQAVAGSVVIVDAQKPSTPAQGSQQQTAIAETPPQAYVNESAMEFDPPVSVAEITADQMLQPNAQGNADISSFASSANSSPEPVFFHTEEKSEPTPAQVVEASETFFIQAEEKLEADPVQAEEKFVDDYVQADEKVEANYLQTEEKFTDDSIQADEKVEDQYVPEAEKSPYSFRELGFVNPPQSNAPTVEQYEREPERQSQDGNFFVVPAVNQFVVPENLHTQEAVPLYPQEAEPFQTQEVASLSPQEVAPQHFDPQEVAPLYPQEGAYQTGQPMTGDLPQAWDDSMDNYPVLMVQEEKRSLLKPLMALAAVALIAFVAAGYWFVYKPYFSGTTPNATQRAGANVEDNSQPTQPMKPEKTPENSSPAPQQETPTNAATPPTTQATPADKSEIPKDATTNLEGQNGQGKYSLQAASFPSQQAASEFSEKLIRSGVPAYIASANIAGKGQWFRVRVGRFVNPTEAEKYAAQAKQRAKATGLNLQLVICDYSNS